MDASRFVPNFQKKSVIWGSKELSKCINLIFKYKNVLGYIFFSTRIEKSREVIPRFIEAARSKQKHQDLNIDLLYKLLFTRENLNLVQVGCHKKAARESGKITWNDFCSEG